MTLSRSHSNDAANMIFIPSKVLPETIRKTRHRLDVLQDIHSDFETLKLFQKLSDSAQESLIEFCMGNRHLNITYDPFFRNIFNPETRPGRLDRFLSAVLEQAIKVCAVLPREGVRLSAESSLMIMDVLVELSDGSLINVEMQKVGYHFPIERSFCYGADLLVRQYDRIRAERGKHFTYRDMKPVYVIVLMEESTPLFHQQPNTFIHRSTFQLTNNIRVPNILNFVYIPLDFFLKIPHNELTELEAWLYFFSSDHPLHIQHIIEKYPFFHELYRDIINFQYHPKELITMFSESLLIADRNTVKLMIDELRDDLATMKKEAAEWKAEVSELNAELSEKNAELAEKEALILELQKKLSEINR